MTNATEILASAIENQRVGRLSIKNYKKCEDADLHGRMLYSGAAMLFLRASVYSLKKIEVPGHPDVPSILHELFETQIENSEAFSVLHDERCRIAHGDDSWVANPFKPQRLIDRGESEGVSWDVIVFDDIWPFHPYKGIPISHVLTALQYAVGGWLQDATKVIRIHLDAHQTDSEDCSAT